MCYDPENEKDPQTNKLILAFTVTTVGLMMAFQSIWPLVIMICLAIVWATRPAE